MSTQQLLLVGGAALLVFWMLGAHNRLVALRSAIVAAWAPVDEALQRRPAAVDGWPGEPGALDAMRAAQAQVGSAAQALREHPVQASRAAALASALAALDAACAQAQTTAPADWQEATRQLGFARQRFNDAVAAYNAAARQFPTRLLARLFGFASAGEL